MSWKAIRPRWLLAGYGVAAVATLAMVLVGGTGHPWPALAFVALAGLVAGSAMTLPEAAFCGTMCWLFYDGFLIGRHAHLAWHPAAREIGPLRDGDNVVNLAEVRRHREVRRAAG